MLIDFNITVQHKHKHKTLLPKTYLFHNAIMFYSHTKHKQLFYAIDYCINDVGGGGGGLVAWILIQKPLAKPKSIIECQDVSMFVKNYVVVWFKDNYAKTKQ